MQICIIYLGRYGAGGNISLELSMWLAKRAEVFSVISSYSDILDQWHSSSLSIIEVPTYNDIKSGVRSIIYWSHMKELAMRIAERKPDVIIYSMFHFWNPLLQLFLRDVPTVTVVHDPNPHPGLVAWGIKKLEDLLIKQTTRCVVLSTKLKPALEHRGVSSNQIDVIPLGVLSHYQSFPKCNGNINIHSNYSDKFNLLFFGRITAYKGIEILLTAFYHLERRYNIQLRIVGNGDITPYHNLLEKLHDVDVVNRWIGESEVPTFFNSSDLVVLPYTSASQSGVIALAAGFGLPVVATNVGGIPEQIQNEKTGLIIDPGNVEQLIIAIERLICDPDLRARLGKSLFIDHHENRSWDKIAGMFYETCIAAINDKELMRSQNYQNENSPNRW